MKEKKIFNIMLVLLVSISVIFNGCKKNEAVKEIAQEAKIEAEKASSNKSIDDSNKEDKEDTQVTYKIHEESEEISYLAPINMIGLDDESYIWFNENGLFLTVFTEYKGKYEVPEDIITFNLIEVFQEQAYLDMSLTVRGKEAYKIDFDEGDFGIAFATEDKDGNIRPAILHYFTSKESRMIDNYWEAIPFIVDNVDSVVPSNNLIEKMAVYNNKDIIITYRSGVKEHWQIQRRSDDENDYRYHVFMLVKLSENN